MNVKTRNGWRWIATSVSINISIGVKTKMNVYKVPSAVFEMNIFNIAEESRFAPQYSHFCIWSK